VERILNPLSIFSFKTLKNWLRLPWAGLLTLSFIAITALVVKFVHVEDYLPPPYFPRYQISGKSMVLKTNIDIDLNLNPDVIFIGSSVADMGFDALTFEQYVRKRGKKLTTYNFGINGAGPLVFYNLVKDVIIPETNVKYIFYGLSLIEFNKNSKVFKKDQKKMLASPYYAIERGEFLPSAWLKKFLFENFSLYRIHDTLWSNFFTDEDTWISFKLNGYKSLKYNAQDRIMPPIANWEFSRFLTQPQKRINRISELLGNYRISNFNVKKVQDLIRLCKDNDIKLILVSMPVLTNPRFMNDTIYNKMIMVDDGASPMERFEQAFNKICSDNEVSCLNLGGHTVFTAKDFYDPIHLYHTGARKLAVALADYLLSNP